MNLEPREIGLSNGAPACLPAHLGAAADMPGASQKCRTNLVHSLIARAHKHHRVAQLSPTEPGVLTTVWGRPAAQGGAWHLFAKF